MMSTDSIPEPVPDKGSNPGPRFPTPPSRRLSLDQATSLMRLGVLGPPRPVDDLIERLSKADGARWLTRVLCGGPLRDAGDPETLLAKGEASLDQLLVMKEHSKSLMGSTSDPEARLAGLAGYFLSIAAGLRHHGKRIGGRGRSGFEAVLQDLSEIAPQPYSDLFADAADRSTS